MSVRACSPAAAPCERGESSANTGDADGLSLLQPALDALPHGVAILDPEGVILVANQPWRVLAVEGRGNPGANYFDLFDRSTAVHPLGCPATVAGVKAVMAGSVASFELEYAYPFPVPPSSQQPPDRAHEVRWYRLTATPFAESPPCHATLTLEDITDRYRSAANLNTILATVEEALILIGADLKIQAFSHSAQINAQLVGAVPLCVGQPIAAYIPPDIYPGFQASCAATLAGQRVETAMRLPGSDGAYFWYDFKFSPVTSATGQVVSILYSAMNVTQRKLAELGLLASEARARSVIQHSLDGIALTDPQGNVVEWNRTMETITGMPAATVLGRPMWSVQYQLSTDEQQTPEMLMALEAHIRRQLDSVNLLDAQVNSFERVFRRADGAQRVLQGSIFPIPSTDGLFLGSVLRDVTEKKQAEADLEREHALLELRVAERTAELAAANQALEQAARLKDEFMASMSHELRTPLTGILGLSEALQLETYGPLTEKQLRSLRTIESSGRHLLDLINEILDLSKIEAGQMELELELCSALDVCEASMQLIRSVAHKRNQKVSLQIESDSLLLIADVRRLKQMLVNLLSNAVKFTPEGGELGLIVATDRSRHTIHFRVWDHGIGIAAENLPKLFQPFRQLDSSLSRHYTGSGLGLSLVQRMARLHEGEVLVESELDQGSCFTIVLPWEQPALQLGSNPSGVATQANASRTPKQERRPGRRRIMLVEDNEMSSSLIKDHLESCGYCVTCFANGADAIQSVDAVRPDVVLVDIQLPGIDGLEVMRRLRQNSDPRVAGVPIIAVTALAMRGDRERCLTAGADLYLAKPVSLPKLAQAVESALYRSRPVSARR